MSRTNARDATTSGFTPLCWASYSIYSRMLVASLNYSKIHSINPFSILKLWGKLTLSEQSVMLIRLIISERFQTCQSHATVLYLPITVRVIIPCEFAASGLEVVSVEPFRDQRYAYSMHSKRTLSFFRRFFLIRNHFHDGPDKATSAGWVMTLFNTMK